MAVLVALDGAAARVDYPVAGTSRSGKPCDPYRSVARGGDRGGNPGSDRGAPRPRTTFTGVANCPQPPSLARRSGTFAGGAGGPA